MKSITIIGLAALLLAGSASAKSKLVLDQTFGLAEDEKIEVLAYQVSSEDGQKTVKVKTGAGITVRPFDSFPAAAQKEILAWAADEAFESSSGLKVRIKETSHNRSVNIKTDDSSRTGDIDEITYVVELENRGDVALEGVTVEAVIYYEHQYDKSEQKLKLSNSATFDVLSEGKEMFKSRTVEIRDEIIKHYRIDSRGNTKPSQYIRGELNGIVVVLKRKDRHGEVVTREFKDGRPPKPKEQPEYLENT